ncbi:hypothetical protein Pam3_71 [Pseudanabaena phage Pam3]|nr:hypothetical protein Pam3_71 [Pseudanabaena phage Pam3]
MDDVKGLCERTFPNCDEWGAAEWFERLANAVMEQDKAVVAGNEMQAQTYRNIAASSAMNLVRGYRTEIRKALEAATALTSLSRELAEARAELAATVRKLNCDNAVEFWKAMGKRTDRALAAEAASASKDERIRELEAALEPFALISSEGVITTPRGYVQITTQAEYFHRAAAIRAPGAP